VGTSNAARLQIHGKPPQERYWQELCVPIEVLNHRVGARIDRKRGKEDVERERGRG